MDLLIDSLILQKKIVRGVLEYKGYTVLYEILPEIESVIIHEIYNQKQMHIRTYKRI